MILTCKLLEKSVTFHIKYIEISSIDEKVIEKSPIDNIEDIISHNINQEQEEDKILNRYFISREC